jgi:hypothetical protein
MVNYCPFFGKKYEGLDAIVIDIDSRVLPGIFVDVRYCKSEYILRFDFVPLRYFGYDSTIDRVLPLL